MTTPFQRQRRYLSFSDFIGSMGDADKEKLRALKVIFAYPILVANAFETDEMPISLRILMEVASAAGCTVRGEFTRIGPDGKILDPLSVDFVADYVVIHPMMNLADHLSAVLDHYRKRYPAAKQVFANSDHHQHEKMIGGPNAKMIALRLLSQYRELDLVLVGFAEHAMLSLFLGSPTDAVIARDEGATPGPARFFGFSSLPDPNLIGTVAKNSRSVRVQRSRGCLAPCTFCTEGQANAVHPDELPWDGRSLANFVDYLERLANDGHFFINITDSSFEDPGRRGREAVLEFCDEIVRRGLQLSFKIHLRAENVLRFSDVDLCLLKDAGVDVIICGIESGSQTELDFYQKIATTQQARDAVAHLERLGTFGLILGYMMFSPIATSEILREKIDFLHEIGRAWDFLNLTNRVLVFPGTLMHRQLVDLGLADPNYDAIGYVPYRYASDDARRMADYFNSLKRRRPEFLALNKLMYDTLNLESRIQNRANSDYRRSMGGDFEDLQLYLKRKRSYLNDLYGDGFRLVASAGGMDTDFLPEFDPGFERRQIEETVQAVFKGQPTEGRNTLFLDTWMSSVNTLGVLAK